jgi:hypothetical protein
MALLNITPEDILRSKTITPGWYRVKVKRVGEKPAKTDGSTTYPVEMIVLSDGEFQGVPIQQVFSEKAPGFAVKFIEACGKEVKREGGQYELTAAVDKELDVFIDNSLYQGRLTNNVKDYRSSAPGPTG